LGFKSNDRSRPEYNYTKWRKSQGFVDEEISILLSRDNTELFTSMDKVFTTSVSKEAYLWKEVISMFEQSIYSMNEHFPHEALTYAQHYNRAWTALRLASQGDYQTSMILFRTVTEALMRANFEFLNLLGNEKNMIDIVQDLDVEFFREGGSLGKLCSSLKRTQLLKPIKDPYKHLQIDFQNSVVHAKFSTWIDSEDNILEEYKQGRFFGETLKRHYSPEKYSKFAELFTSMVELQTIFFQNIIDTIEGHINKPSIVSFHSMDSFTEWASISEKFFPNLTKLLEDRIRDSRVGCPRCWKLTEVEQGPRDIQAEDLRDFKSEKELDKLIQSRRSQSEIPAIIRFRIEPGRILKKCSCGCEENWQGFRFRPGIPPSIFTCKSGENVIIPGDLNLTDCPICAGLGVEIIDCECGHATRCGRPSSQFPIIYTSSPIEVHSDFAEEIKRISLERVSGFLRDLINQDVIKFVVSTKLENTVVGIGKRLIKSECGCDENWVISWTPDSDTAELHIEFPDEVSSSNKCGECKGLGVKMVSCDCDRCK